MSPLLHRRLSDEALGSRLASGEAAAFDELYRRYVHRLAAYGAHLLGDAAAGDDVAQSTMLKAYGALRDGRVPQRMRPWLFRIAHNAAIDVVARRREYPAAELPERPAHDEPRAAALLEALAALPQRQRDVYVLRELHGLRIQEACAELGLTTVQVEQALFAARNRLAEHLTFGGRLNCVAVQRLAAGPLDTTERRALKTHLRSCSTCRSELGLRGRALSVLPAAIGDWIRTLASTLIGSGAPAAAKVGAVVATASVAAVPAAVHDVPPHPRVIYSVEARTTSHRHVTRTRMVVHAAVAPSAAVAVAAVTPPPPRPAPSTVHAPAPAPSHRHHESAAGHGEARVVVGGGDGGGGHPAAVEPSSGDTPEATAPAVATTPAPVPAPAPAPPPTAAPTVTSSDDGGSHDGGGDGSSGSHDGGSGTSASLDGGGHDGGGSSGAD